MQIQLQWQGRMSFESTIGSHAIAMDAKKPVGDSTAPNPKELLLAGLAGCTAMDVIALMKKHKQNVKSFKVKGHASSSTDRHPSVFTAVKLDFVLEGEVSPELAVEAVQLSQTRYCGVSAMLVKSFPITWEVHVNGKAYAVGQAQFDEHQ